MTIVKEILSWTVEILITLVIAFTFVYFIGLRTSVVGQSMSETLESGDEILDRKSTRLNSSHSGQSRMPSSA